MIFKITALEAAECREIFPAAPPMNKLTYLYAVYWIIAYLVILLISLYGFFRLHREKLLMPAHFLKYVSITGISILSLWAIWKMGLYLSGGLSASEFARQGGRFIGDSAADIVALFFLSGLLLLICGFYRSKIITLISYALLCFAVGGIITNIFTTEAPKTEKYAASDFPGGEKKDYLKNYLESRNYRNTLFVSSNPETNAWVTDQPNNLDIYFTESAVELLTKEQLLGVMLHEIGHKHYSFWVKTAASEARTVTTLILTGWLLLMLLMGLLPVCGNYFGLRLDKSMSKRHRTRLLKAVFKILLYKLAAVVVLFAASSLPVIAGLNYLQRLEEINADNFAVSQLAADGLPAAYFFDGLRAMHRKEVGSDEDADRLYQFLFSDHPSTTERTVNQGK